MARKKRKPAGSKTGAAKAVVMDRQIERRPTGEQIAKQRVIDQMFYVLRTNDARSELAKLRELLDNYLDCYPPNTEGTTC